VTVRNNTIRRPGLGLLAGGDPFGIFIHHETPQGKPTDSQPNKDISLIDNDIQVCASAGMDLSDVTNLTLEGNEIQDINRLDYSNSGYGVRLSNVDEATLAENSVVGSSETVSAFGFRTESQRISLSNNDFQVDERSVPVRLLGWDSLSLEFSRTVFAGERPLAFCCFDLRLLDGDDTVIRDISVGEHEEGILFHEGVDGHEQSDGETWRWLGPEDEVSVIKFFDTELARATTLEMRGYPIEENISATVHVDGTKTDDISWDTTQTRTYQLSVTES
jgi:hypothetical protein